MNKKITEARGLGGEVKKVEQGLCPTCHKLVSESDFRDVCSKREFLISGMCQKCQDETFGK